MAVTTMKFVQAHNYTRGRSNAIDVLVIHTMESPEKPDAAESVANWFAGAPGANHNGLGFEHAGRAAQTTKD